MRPDSRTARWLQPDSFPDLPAEVAATVHVNGDPTDLAVLPQGDAIYVGHELAGHVSVVDTAVLEEVDQIACGRSPWMLAAAPDGQRVYVVNQYDGTLSIVHTADNKVIATVTGVGNSPSRCRVSHDGLTCFVTDQNGNRVTLVDTVACSVRGRVAVGLCPRDVDCSPDGELICTANVGGTTLSCVHLSDRSQAATIDVGFRPHRVRFLPGGGLVAAAEYYGSRLAIASISDRASVRTLDLGAPVVGICSTNGGSYLYVASDYEAGAVCVVRTSDWRALGFVRTGFRPTAVDAPVGGAFVASSNRVSRTVTVIGKIGPVTGAVRS
jgi:YVTN family beta-propeller protein